jgi:tape measure domain-containing protein
VSIIGKLVVAVVGDMTALRKDLDSMQKNLKKTFGREGLDASYALTRSVGFLAAGLGAAAVAGVKLASDWEQAEIAFTTMLGSSEAAKDMLNDLAILAAKTPFELPGLVDASKKMLAFGFTADQIIPSITAIGDAVAGLGGGADVIDRVTRAIGQMQAKGKVSAQEMNQLAENGIPAWEILAEKIGTDIPTAMKRAETTGISAAIGVDAILTGLSDRFGGMMQKQAETIGGLFSTAKDNVTAILRELGIDIVETFNLKEKLKGANEWLADFAQQLKDGGIGQALATMIPPGLQVTLLGVAGAISGGMVPALKDMALNIAKMLPLVLNPWVLGLAAAGVAIGMLITQVQKERVETEKSLMAHEKQIAAGDDLITQYERLANKTNKTNEEKARMIDLSNKIAEVLPDAVKGYDKEGNAIIDLNLAMVNLIALKREELALRAKEIGFQIQDLEKKNKQLKSEQDLIKLGEERSAQYRQGQVTAEQTRKIEADYTNTLEKKGAEMRRNQTEIEGLKQKQQELLDQSTKVTAETIKNDLKLSESSKQTGDQQKTDLKTTGEELEKLKEKQDAFVSTWTEKYRDATASNTRNLQEQLNQRLLALGEEEKRVLKEADDLKLTDDQKLVIEQTFQARRQALIDESNRAISDSYWQQYQSNLDAEASYFESMAAQEELNIIQRTQYYNQALQLKLQILDLQRQAAIDAATAEGRSTEQIEREYSLKRQKIVDDEEKAKKTMYNSMASQLMGYAEQVRKGEKSIKDIIKEQLISMLDAREQAIIADAVAGIAQAWATAPMTFGASLSFIGGILANQGLAIAAIEGAKGLIRGLETGGLVRGGTGGGVFQVGEGSQDEIVSPLETGIDLMTAGIVDKLSKMNSPVVNVGGSGGFGTANIYIMLDDYELGRRSGVPLVEELFIKAGVG